MRTLQLADALAGPAFEPTGPCAIDIADGRVAAIRPLAAPPAGPRRLALPAPVNAHDHARPLSTASFGATGRPLETWLLALAAVPPVDPYLATAAALGRAARGGAAGELVHLTRPMGLTPLPEEAREIARAAADVGIRVALAIGMKDRNPLVYGDAAPVLGTVADPAVRGLLADLVDRPQPSPAEQVALVEEVARAVEGTSVDVQFGPNGPQWCSDALLEAVAEASARTGRRVHMHLLETRPQRAFADAAYPGGIARHLADIGLLSERITLAHCVWARPDELEIIAGSGATVVVNSSSNLGLRSGLAPVAEMVRRGVRVAIGVDGAAIDDDDDALREMRLAHVLHAGVAFEEVLTPARTLKAAAVAGRPTIGAPEGGVLAEGAPADLLVLDLDALDRDRVVPVDPRTLLFARARKECLVELVVAGRTVADATGPVGIDLPAVEAALREAFRAAGPGTDPLARAFPAIEPAVAAFYRESLGCC